MEDAVFVLEAQADLRAVRHVHGEAGQEPLPFDARVVAEPVGVLAAEYQARADTAVRRQRYVDVADGILLVPASGAHGQARAERAARALAHQVDGGGGIAGAAQQSVRAAHDADAVVEIHVDRAAAAAVERGPADDRQAIDLVVGDVESAGPVGGAPAVVQLDESDARGAAQDVADGLHALVVHLLAGHHRHGLGRFLWTQCQAGRGAGRGHGIGACRLGGLVGLPAHFNGRQRGRCGRRVAGGIRLPRLDRGGSGRQGKRDQAKQCGRA